MKCLPSQQRRYFNPIPTCCSPSQNPIHKQHTASSSFPGVSCATKCIFLQSTTICFFDYLIVQPNPSCSSTACSTSNLAKTQNVESSTPRLSTSIFQLNPKGKVFVVGFRFFFSTSLSTNRLAGNHYCINFPLIFSLRFSNSAMRDFLKLPSLLLTPFMFLKQKTFPSFSFFFSSAPMPNKNNGLLILFYGRVKILSCGWVDLRKKILLKTIIFITNCNNW